MDDDGYPDAEEIEFFKTTPLSVELLHRLHETWWSHGWGYVDRGRDFELHTGGWSGNESIIEALEQNDSFWKYLVKHEQGGHYYFKFPEEATDTMPALLWHMAIVYAKLGDWNSAFVCLQKTKHTEEELRRTVLMEEL